MENDVGLQLTADANDRVLESIKAGKRLPEARFANLKLASKGQQSVYGLFGGALKSSGSSTSPRSQSPIGS
jgi:hypothetical protein